MLDGYLDLRGSEAWHSGLGGTPGWMGDPAGEVRAEEVRSWVLPPDTLLWACGACGGRGRSGRFRVLAVRRNRELPARAAGAYGGVQGRAGP